MAMKLITGYTGTKHITPADDAGLHKSIFGDGDFVLHSGSQLAATIQSATEVRIADGELVMQGRHARNDSGYQAVTIANGTQGMYRNDLIVARYTKESSTSVESISLIAITGTATSGTASDPAYSTGNIENGETRDFPLYRVKLNGINIEKVEQLWQSPVLPVERGGTGKTTVAGIKSLLGLAKAAFVDLVTVALGGTGKSSHTSNAVLTGNGTNAVNNVATANGALYATTANGAAKFGILPIAQGGTGSTTKEGALSALGLTATAAELNYMDGVTSSVQTQLNNKSASNHNHDSSYLKQYALNSINIDNTSGNWTVDISESGHGAVPMTWVNVTQTTGAHFIVQTAKKCDTSQSASNRDQRIWIRDKYSQGGVWSNWREVLTDGNGVQWTKVWENSNPTAEMGSFSDRTTDVGKYDLFLLFFRASTGAAREISVIARKGKAGEVHDVSNLFDSSAVKFCGRTFTMVDYYGGIDIQPCYVRGTSSGEPSTDNTKLIPVAIYGCMVR
jgi:hypothetical protein